MSNEDKIVHFRLKENPEITVEEVYEMMSELQKKYPDREIFYDGDLQAICSRPKKITPRKD
ncbi:MAG: hypothetical protein ACP5LA_04805 [Thermoplasmata archaeon]